MTRERIGRRLANLRRFLQAERTSERVSEMLRSLSSIKLESILEIRTMPAPTGFYFGMKSNMPLARLETTFAVVRGRECFWEFGASPDTWGEYWKSDSVALPHLVRVVIEGNHAEAAALLAILQCAVKRDAEISPEQQS